MPSALGLVFTMILHLHKMMMVIFAMILHLHKMIMVILTVIFHLHYKLLIASSIVDGVGWGEQTHTLWENIPHQKENGLKSWEKKHIIEKQTNRSHPPAPQNQPHCPQGIPLPLSEEGKDFDCFIDL